jgi:hypothetical protein
MKAKTEKASICEGQGLNIEKEGQGRRRREGGRKNWGKSREERP